LGKIFAALFDGFALAVGFRDFRTPCDEPFSVAFDYGCEFVLHGSLRSDQRHPNYASILPRALYLPVLKAEVRETGVVVGTAPLGPVEEPLGFGDGEVVDAGVSLGHEAVGVELPELVAVRAEPLPGLIVRLVAEAHGHAVFLEAPKLFDEAVAGFACPLAREEGDDLVAAVDELGAVAPAAVDGIGERDFLRVASVPCVFGFADLFASGFESEGWEWGTLIFGHMLGASR